MRARPVRRSHRSRGALPELPEAAAPQRRASRWRYPAGVVTVLALAWSAPPPALAHQFSMVVVSAESVQSRDARRGLVAAVDQSPDVGHTPGPDAGDHLGGVDVDLIAIDEGEDPTTADRVGELLDAGASAVVVLLVPESARAISAAAATRDKLALVVSDSVPSDRPTSLLLHPRPSAEPDGPSVADATTALRDALSDEPTRAALLGYDAGRLLDKITAQVGEALRPSGRLMTVAREASADLAASRVAGAEAEVDDRGEREVSGGAGILTAVTIGATAVAVAGALIWIMRRRRWAEGGRH